MTEKVTSLQREYILHEVCDSFILLLTFNLLLYGCDFQITLPGWSANETRQNAKINKSNPILILSQEFIEVFSLTIVMKINA